MDGREKELANNVGHTKNDDDDDDVSSISGAKRTHTLGTGVVHKERSETTAELSTITEAS